MINRLEQDFQGLNRDWVAVGAYLSEAMQEVALNLGGEELGASVAAAAVSDGSLPNPAGLKLLEKNYPGSAEIVMARMEQIQQESHKRELAEMSNPSIRKYGKAMLDGFSSFIVFGTLPRRHH